MNEEELKVSLLEVLESIDRNVSSVHPETMTGLTIGQELVLGLFAGCRRLFRGIYLLLSESMAEEARILLRPMLEDTITLEYSRRKRDRLDELALRYTFESLREERGLAQEALNAGSSNASDTLQRIDKEAQAVRETASELGIGKLRGLPSKKDMLLEAGQPPGVNYLIKLASHAVHTSRIMLAQRFREVDEDHFVIHPESSPEQVFRVGTETAQVFSLATLVSAELLHWDKVTDVRAFRAQVLKDVEELILRTGFRSPEASTENGVPRL